MLSTFSRKENHNLFFTRLSRGGESVQNKTSIVSLRCRFSGGNKYITQKKGETIFIVMILLIVKYIYLEQEDKRFKALFSETG